MGYSRAAERRVPKVSRHVLVVQAQQTICQKRWRRGVEEREFWNPFHFYILFFMPNVRKSSHCVPYTEAIYVQKMLLQKNWYFNKLYRIEAILQLWSIFLFLNIGRGIKALCLLYLVLHPAKKKQRIDCWLWICPSVFLICIFHFILVV